jgi:hypothetical protein
MFRFEATEQIATAPSASAPSASAPSTAVDAEWSEELEACVLRAMVMSFDNYAAAEVEALLRALVDAAARGSDDAERSLRKLATLSRRLEALERAAQHGADGVAVQDEARALFSEVRMWGKDGERYMEGASDSWLGWLEGLRKGL